MTPKRWPTPSNVRTAGRSIGEHVTAWRKLQRLTAAQVAERAGISPVTLRKLEHGEITVTVGTLLRVCNVLGVMNELIAALDPYETPMGRMRADEQLPQRVRSTNARG